MTRRALLASAALCALLSIGAYNEPGAGGAGGGATVYYNVYKYGGVCNGDIANAVADTRAINAMFAAVRALPNNSSLPTIDLRAAPGATTQKNACMITTGDGGVTYGVNATSAGSGLDGLSSQNKLVILGGRLECQTSGHPCFDMSGGNYYHFVGTVINSVSGPSEPNYGLQIARLHTGVPAGAHYFDRVTVQGAYTRAAVLSFASEDNTWIEPQISNNDTLNSTLGGPAQYSFIDDGCQHFAVASQFQTIDIPPSTVTSDKLVNIFGGQISIGAGAGYIAPVFMGCTTDHRYYGTYINSNSNYAIHYFGLGTSNPLNTDLKVNIEGANVQNVFLLENNSNPTQAYNGLKFDGGTVTGSGGFFGVSGGHTPLTSVTINNLDLRVQINSVSTLTLFDNPALYSINGRVELPGINQWSAPVRPNSLSSVTLCMQNVTPSCQEPVPAPPITRNPDFLIDQAHEFNSSPIAANGQIVTDGWHANWSGSYASTLTSLVTAAGGSLPNFYFLNSLQTTVAASQAPAATDWYDYTSTIDGGDMAQFRWGLGAQSAPAFMHYCIKSSVAPVTPPLYLSNGNTGSPLFFNIDDTITAANAWTCFAHQISAPQTGTWNKVAGTVGLRIGLTMTDGASNNVGCVDGQWQTQTCRSTPASTAITGLPNGATINIGYLHIFKGLMDVPEQPIPLAVQVAQAQRWYRKSFRLGSGNLPPQQNVGYQPGAMAMQLPYAQTAKGTAQVKVNYNQPMWTGQNAHIPVVTFFSPNAASGNCYNATQSRDSGAAVALNNSESGFMMQCALVAGDALGDTLYTHFTADNGW